MSEPETERDNPRKGHWADSFRVSLAQQLNEAKERIAALEAEKQEFANFQLHEVVKLRERVAELESYLAAEVPTDWKIEGEKLRERVAALEAERDRRMPARVEEHLDWHHTLADLAAARARIGAPERDGLLDWAVCKWHNEVSNRPLVNVHRRTLDDTWRQVIRFAGGDPVELVGPAHDDLLAGEEKP